MNTLVWRILAGVRLKNGETQNKNKLTSVFGGVKIYEINGYYVFVAEKRKKTMKEKEKTTNNISKKLQRKQQRYKVNRQK